MITGLVGLQPRSDDVLVVDPLQPRGVWPYFCLDGIPYHDHSLTVVWNVDGTRYGLGRGLRLLVDGNEVGAVGELARIETRLPD